MSLPAAAVKIVDGKMQIYLPSDQDSYGAALGVLYAHACGEFRMKEFAQRYPAEKESRRSLAEEVSGLEAMLRFDRESAASPDAPKVDADRARWKPSLNQLAEVQKAGLLEAFALLERADAELARDFAAYRPAHREDLVRYIRVFWCGLP